MNKAQKNNIYLIVGLLVLAIGLFAYQNFFMPAQLQAKRAVIYVAGTHLADETVIDTSKSDQFKAIQVSEDSVVPGSVTNLESVNGKVIEGGLLEGELLSTSRLADPTDDKGDLYVKIEPDFPVDIRDGENIAVFVNGQNEESGESQVVELFSKKQVHASSRVTNIIEGESSQGYYLRMNDKELVDYYLAKGKGAIIVAKIVPMAGDIAEELGATGTLDDLAPKTEEKIEESSKETVVEQDGRYEVGEGETFETIAHDLEISVSALKDENPQLNELRAGDKITIPGQ